MKILLLVVFVLVIAGGAVAFWQRPGSKTQPAAQGLTYLPLGDSYTIGQSVAEPDRWPNQLVAKLGTDNIQIQIVANPARTGYTTQDLIDKELPILHKLKPEIVSLQIGVNDWVQGVDEATFHKNLRFILDDIQRTIPDKSKIVLVTIPDYSKTPTGSSFGDPMTNTTGIVAFNKIISAEATARNLPVADIFAISQNVLQDPSLVANDGLHPSAKQYAKWVEQILPTFRQIVN